MTGPQILTAEAVSQVMIACLCDEGIPGQMVHGVESEFFLNPEALQLATSRIQCLLAELPDEFRDTNEKAGAWSFLNAIEDRHGNRWAPDHLHVEALFALGLAVDLVEWTRPREEWHELPGGFPYVTVLASKFPAPEATASLPPGWSAMPPPRLAHADYLYADGRIRHLSSWESHAPLPPVTDWQADPDMSVSVEIITTNAIAWRYR